LSLDALLAADFKTPPWRHQLDEFETSAEAPSRALLWQMRTGKSKFTLDTASHLFRAGLADTGLVFAPNGVHANWIEREAPRHLWDSVSGDTVLLAWRSRIAGLKGGNRLSKADKAAWEDAHAGWWREYEYALKHARYALLAFNNESVTREDVRKALAKLVRKRGALAVWDESSDYAAPDASRTKMMRALARHTKFRRILDGTLITQSPLDAFSQFELLEHRALGFTAFTSYRDKAGVYHPGFKDKYGEYELARGAGGRFYPKLVGFKNLEDLRARMAPYSSVVLREDCADLPDVRPERRAVQLSPEQERVYRDVEEQIRIEVEAGTVAEIGAQVSKLLKLQQVLGGFLIDEDGRVHRVPGVNPRLEALSEEVFFASGRVIVWCQFHEELDSVAARLRADGLNVMEYHGRISDEEKLRVRAEFPTAPADTVLVGQPQSGGRGLELPADLILWYSHTFKARTRMQANERATVMGGKNVRLLDFVAPGVDGYILNRIESRIDIADDIAGRGLQEILREASLGRATA
jgi:hypothetical protein